MPLHLLILVTDLFFGPSGDWSLDAANLIILYPAAYNDFFMGELDTLALVKFSCLLMLTFERENRGARSS